MTSNEETIQQAKTTIISICNLLIELTERMMKAEQLIAELNKEIDRAQNAIAATTKQKPRGH